MTVIVVILLGAAAVSPTRVGLKVLGFTLVWLLISGAIESWIFMTPGWRSPDRKADDGR